MNRLLRVMCKLQDSSVLQHMEHLEVHHLHRLRVLIKDHHLRRLPLAFIKLFPNSLLWNECGTVSQYFFEYNSIALAKSLEYFCP